MIDWKQVNEYAGKQNPEPPRRVEKSEEEWKEELTPTQFRVTRKHGTERAGTGEYCEAQQPGLYACVCCGTELFDSSGKFKSGSGWPSFAKPVQGNAIRYVEDLSHGMHRIEVLCNVCDAHLGHVFPDGPQPTGLRYCVNSASLQLVEKSD
ncbi:peptide-methionine (R)-S-oxide reductase MsrB [Fodinibius halophilus]|uniref:Peptide methionine sulfoxide reductase MsrB n=1 Tax=Fodinibius halophilus TaxID=1736908 RepID=A0A6M1TF83_9BACT|nr:peptide-methionine (R)-S-oxide reductase MsrB [Fodinibius halophilus]NGP89444.1 peptide-methionine (R)-S-oxide reductase MsrB [Fodinibius halophilus]